MRPGERRMPRLRPAPLYCSAATQPASVSSATGASSPSARRRRALPPLAPSERTERRLFASPSRSPAATAISAWKPIAVRTNCAAGRACRSTPAGSETSRSELGDGTGLLRGRGDLVDRPADRRDNGGRDRALDQWRVDESDAAVAGVAVEHVAGGQDGA